MLLSHVPLVLHQDWQVLVCRAGHQPLRSELMLVHEVVPPGIGDFVFPVVKVRETIPPSVQDSVFPIAKLHEGPSDFMLQLVKLPVKDRTFSFLTNN